jgi:hypothetical protein
MATIYSSLGSIYQDLKEWQLSIDYFRREMSCRIGLGVKADIEVVFFVVNTNKRIVFFPARLFSL